MPRQARKDLSYFTLDCDIFSKTAELRPLLRKFKADGLAVYIHILCDVYGTGYYFKPDDYEGYLLDLAEDCGITVEKVQLIIAFMQDRTLREKPLLDAFSLDKNTVFTSHGIQKRYAQAMKGRKRSVAEIKGEYWLLTEVEEQKIDTFYKTQSFADKSEKNADKSEKNADKSEIYPITELNRNSMCVYSDTHTFSKPTVEQIAAYATAINKQMNAQRFYDFYESKGWTVGNQPMQDWKACVRSWQPREGEQAASQSEKAKEQADYDRTADIAAERKQRLLDSDADFYQVEKELRLANIKAAKGEDVDITTLEEKRREILARHGMTEQDIEVK